MLLAELISAPTLIEGDSLTSDEFLRRWDEISDLKYAELMDGIVYMPAPVSHPHGRCKLFLASWLDAYATATPGCEPIIDGTWLMGENQVPQPDLALRILSEYGGQSAVKGLYPSGAPELVVEVAVSSRSRDFGAKKRLYERAGVHEYVIALPRSEELLALSLTPHGFRPLEVEDSGVFKSHCFPGLWLDTAALWSQDRVRRNTVLQQGLATPEHVRFLGELAARKR